MRLDMELFNEKKESVRHEVLDVSHNDLKRVVAPHLTGDIKYQLLKRKEVTINFGDGFVLIYKLLKGK